MLLHGYPSSSRMFDSLLPLLATRYHLIAPDYPGFGQSDAPPPSQYDYTFDHLAETTNALLEQLKIDRYHLYLQDYGGPIGFRIMVAHSERVRARVIQLPTPTRKGSASSGPASPNIGRIGPPIRNRSTHLSRSKAPGSATSPGARIPNVTIPTPGPTNTPSCLYLDSGKSRPSCSTIIGRTSPPTPPGRRGCASTNRRH